MKNSRLWFSLVGFSLLSAILFAFILVVGHTPVLGLDLKGGLSVIYATAEPADEDELPIALPLVLAGVRTAAVINVGTATIAAFVGAGGFGERIATGLALNDRQLLLAGALPAAGLAFLIEGAFALLERRVSRWARVS